MAKTTDVYRDWLGVQDRTRPLNHYQLFRLKNFEDSPARIREHYRKMTSHVRRFLASDEADRAQKLLTELTAAMLCLTDVRRKQEYDATLGRTDKADVRRGSFEDVLLAKKVVTQEQLAKAQKYADAVGLDMRDAVLQQKLATPEAVMMAYAESVGLPYVELSDFGVATELVRSIPAATARQHSCVPVMGDAKQVIMASPNPLKPDVEEELRLRLNKQVHTVLCTPAAIHEAVSRHYPREAVVAEATNQADKLTEDQSGKTVVAETAPPTERELWWMRLKGGILGFNITVIVTIIALGFYRGAAYRMGYWDIVIAALLGSVGALVGRALGPPLLRKK